MAGQIGHGGCHGFGQLVWLKAGAGQGGFQLGDLLPFEIQQNKGQLAMRQLASGDQPGRASNFQIDTGPAAPGIGIVISAGHFLDQAMGHQLGGDSRDRGATDPGQVGQFDSRNASCTSDLGQQPAAPVFSLWHGHDWHQSSPAPVKEGARTQ